MRACSSARGVTALLVGVGALISGHDAAAFAFLCNGTDAGGNARSDGCAAPCSASSAARWRPAALRFHVDASTVPSGLTVAQWGLDLTTSLTVWNELAGTTLVLSSAGVAGGRSFGGDAARHEIFWVPSADEWREQVGGGENGTLGTTLPRYVCGPPREIYDADIALNGTGAFAWGCQGQGCSDVVATLAHEVGHAFGLGHPCIGTADECDALMMAVDAVRYPGPVFDDAEGARALYPGPSGGAGAACAGDGACESGSCIVVDARGGPVRYCGEPCGSCPGAMRCEPVDGEGERCVYSAGETPAGAAVGESCHQRACDDACEGAIGANGCNVCVGVGADARCYLGCNVASGAGCGAGQACRSLVGGGGACMAGDSEVGQPCGGPGGFCADGLECAQDALGQGYCRRSCVSSSGAGCAVDEACIPLVGGTGACFPGGSVAEGGVCETVFDCALGHVCLIDAPNDGSHCYRRCDQGYECASPTQECVAVTGAAYCDPIYTGGGGVDEVDAGPAGEGEGEGGEGEGGEGEGAGGEGEGEAGPGEGADDDARDPSGPCSSRQSGGPPPFTGALALLLLLGGLRPRPTGRPAPCR